MKILKVTFQNFKSYGNKKVVLDFAKEFDSTLTLLSGKNGTGKTTVKEVLEFGLYGKVDGFTLKDLPNRSNKALYVKILFLSKGKEISIERGIHPSLFKLKINGKEYDEAGKRNIQDYIESELFEIPYHIFKNIIVLSINSFKSFLTMSPKDKRDIIDRIFGFDILNKMTEEVKVDKKEAELDYVQIGIELSSIQGTIDDLKDRLVVIQSELKIKQTDEMLAIKKKIDVFQEKIKPLEEQYDKFKKEIVLNESKLQKDKESVFKNKQKIVSINKSYTLYNNNKCSECGSDLTTKDHLDKKNKLKKDLFKIKDIIVKSQKIVDSIQIKLNAYSKKYNDVVADKAYCDTQIRFLKTKVVDLIKNSDAAKKNPNITGLQKMLKNYEVKQVGKKDEQTKYEKNKLFYKRVEEMLSNSGIKQMVINNILPLLNNNISDALRDLDINFSVKIDNLFNCIVTSLGTEINVKSLSTGERVRLDYAILLSLMKLIKLQFPSLNVFFLDEIFSNIDLESINGLIEMVKNLTKDLALSIFLVSHSPVDEILFDKKVVLMKKNTFSELSIETL